MEDRKEKQGKFGFYRIMNGQYRGRVAWYYKDEFSYPSDDGEELIFYDGDPCNPSDWPNMQPHLMMLDTESMNEGLGGCTIFYQDMEACDQKDIPPDVLRNYILTQNSKICIHSYHHQKIELDDKKVT